MSDSVLHGRDGPQTQHVVVAGDKHQIHDLSRSSEKSVSRVAVWRRYLLHGRHGGAERRFPERCRSLSQPRCEIRGGAESSPSQGAAVPSPAIGSTALLCYLARLSSTTKRSTSRASTPGARAAVANCDRDFR